LREQTKNLFERVEIMNQNDAEKQIIIEWENWKRANDVTEASYNDKDVFYRHHLQKVTPQLLTFRVGHGQDRWQDIQAWINDYENKKRK